jgi:hypothetical protein
MRSPVSKSRPGAPGTWQLYLMVSRPSPATLNNVLLRSRPEGNTELLREVIFKNKYLNSMSFSGVLQKITGPVSLI